MRCVKPLNILLRHMGWFEATDLIVKGTSAAINAKTVTYDLDYLAEVVNNLKYNQFFDSVIESM